MRRVTLGRGDEAMARVLAGDSADAIRWLHGRGIRFRLMYERQSYEADGRHRFWGGLAVGVVDGGRGLIDQHAAAAEAHGIEVRHEAAVEELVDGGRAWSRRRRRCGRAAVVLAAGGFESNPQMRAAHLGPNWDVAKVRGTPYNTGEVLRAALRRGAQPYGQLERLPRDPVGPRRAADRRPGADQPLLAPVLSGRDRRQPRRRALHRRGRGLPQLHVREVRRRGARAARPASRSRSSTPRSVPLLRTIDYEAPGATRVDADSLGELAAKLGIDAERFERTVREFNAAIVAGRVRPGGQGRGPHRGAGRAEVQLGAADPGAAVHRVPGHVRDHVHVRRRAGGRATRACWTCRPPAARPVRGRRARRRAVLPQLSGRHPG